MTTQNDPVTDVEPISAEEARALLDAAIRERLGEDWQDEHEGWSVITRHDYMARLNKDRSNLDFYIDLLGNITVEEKEINPGQDTGRFQVLFFFGGSFLVALLIARLAGYL